MALLHRLMQGPATVGVLVKNLGLKQANVSKQLGILYRARLLSRAKKGLTVEYKLKHKAINKLCGAACELMRGCSEGLSF
ncbi:MAG: helix-turn-helix transcriptional regulator [Deltaproteobacteria bacterium]|nr:helix-turn-helix transcriptional regulator [Deltaproteobacteria bacterium]